MIGQFYGPYSTVRPAKFESSPDAISFVYQNLLQRNFESYFENICIRTKHFEKQKRKEQGLTKFKVDFSDLESVPDPEHHTSQKLDNFLSAER